MNESRMRSPRPEGKGIQHSTSHIMSAFASVICIYKLHTQMLLLRVYRPDVFIVLIPALHGITSVYISSSTRKVTHVNVLFIERWDEVRSKKRIIKKSLNEFVPDMSTSYVVVKKTKPSVILFSAMDVSPAVWEITGGVMMMMRRMSSISHSQEQYTNIP